MALGVENVETACTRWDITKCTLRFHVIGNSRMFQNLTCFWLNLVFLIWSYKGEHTPFFHLVLVIKMKGQNVELRIRQIK